MEGGARLGWNPHPLHLIGKILEKWKLRFSLSRSSLEEHPEKFFNSAVQAVLLGLLNTNFIKIQQNLLFLKKMHKLLRLDNWKREESSKNFFLTWVEVSLEKSCNEIFSPSSPPLSGQNMNVVIKRTVTLPQLLTWPETWSSVSPGSAPRLLLAQY